MNTRKEALAEIKKQFEESHLLPLFEIEVYSKNTGKTDYIIFEISIQDRYLVAQHESLTIEEEESDKIPNKRLIIDTDFSLDENLQSLIEICQEAIMESDFYALS